LVSSLSVSSTPLWPCRFRLTCEVFPPAPSPVFLRIRVHPLRSLAPSSEYVATCQIRPMPASTEHSPWVSVPSSRQQHKESTIDALSTARLTFRPQCFSHSRRFTPPRTFVGLFHPTATCKVHSSGGFPSTQPTRLIDVPFPHVVSFVSLSPSCPDDTRS
jgi:hypothetical protein